MTAKFQVESLSILCDKCKQALPSPTGSLFWTAEDLDAQPESFRLVCQECGADVKVKRPKRVSLP